MAQVIESIVVSLSGPAYDAMRESVTALGAALTALNALPEDIGSLLDGALGDLLLEAVDNPSDLFRCEVVDRSALGANEVRVRCDPSDRYRELVSAITTYGGDRFSLDISHGWPILSVGCCSTTVTDGAVMGNRAASEESSPTLTGREKGWKR